MKRTLDKEKFDLVIRAGRGEKAYWYDLWRFRELLYFLSWRDILVRYKQTVIGIAWSVIRPLLTMVIFVLVFSKLAKLPSAEGVPYPLLVFVALLPWQLFATALSDSSNSLVQNANMIAKIYFPRMIVPLSTLVVALVDFIIAFVLLVGLMVIFQFVPDWRMLFLPFFILLALLAAIGVGLFISALNVKYRDFKHVVPFLVQVGMYISPVGFNSSIVPDSLRFLYSLNPMVGVIDGFRWCLLGSDAVQLYVPGLIASCVMISGMLYVGIKYFRRTERTFADVI